MRLLLAKSCLILLLCSLAACSWNDTSNRSSSQQTRNKQNVKTPIKKAQTNTRRPKTHTVASGEGFYTIARRYGLDYRKLAAWNNMSLNDVIFKGMKLKLYPPKNTPPTSTSSSSKQTANASKSPQGSVNKAIKLIWPLRGRIINKFNALDNTVKGIDIAGQTGQRIKAAASGKVVYSGSGLVGLGNVIVIKHNDVYLTAYGYNDKLLLSEGAVVTQGQDIAIIGIGLDNQTMLHFELRKNGQPIDPMSFLAK